MRMKAKSIVSINDLAKDDIVRILDMAGKLESKPEPELLKGKILATLFFEPSTRTRLSTESAMLRLGGKVISVASGECSSIKKGESISDTMRMVENYADVIAFRDPNIGAAREAADASSVPVINCGDGSNEHPTQALIDLYTIKKAHGMLEGLNIALMGDLKYGRTVHSLVRALSHFGCNLFFIAPKGLELPKEYLKELDRKGINYEMFLDIMGVMDRLDILYCTRVQEERFSDPEEFYRLQNSYQITPQLLETAKPTLKVMHPLPRVGEITPEVDKTEHAYYFEQAKNAVVVRMAILGMLCEWKK